MSAALLYQSVGMCRLTTSTLPLPLSLRVNGNDSSSPVEGSWSVRNAWCGLLPVLPSVVVRTILRLSDPDRLTAGDRAEVKESLCGCQQHIEALAHVSKDSLLFNTTTNASTLLLNCKRGIFEAPACTVSCRRCGQKWKRDSTEESHCERLSMPWGGLCYLAQRNKLTLSLQASFQWSYVVSPELRELAASARRRRTDVHHY